MKLESHLAKRAIKSRDTRILWQEDFMNLSTLLDQYYHLQKLKLVCASINARNIYNHPLTDIEAIFSPILQAAMDQSDIHPLGKAYYLSIQMLLSNHGGKYFQELLLLLGRETHQFAAEEGMELYGYALNFCIYKTNQGNYEYLEHTSTLYQQLLENKLILENGELLPQQLKNIVTLHCGLGKLDWVRRFIDDYGPQLPEANRVQAINYNEAVLSFYRKDYEHAIEQFKEIIATLTDDIFYGLDARAYLWKSYFENHSQLSMSDVDEMYRLYDAFRLFINRNNKVSQVHKLHYRNFIRVFKRYIEILSNFPVQVNQLEQLREEALEMDALPNKVWLLSKINNSIMKFEAG